MRVLLTGGYGCIGTWLAANLLERGDRVFVYDLKSGKQVARLTDTTFVVVKDLGDQEEVTYFDVSSGLIVRKHSGKFLY